MPRRIDPERHRQQRLRIVDAALTCFARAGFDGASTAQICREAGIGSGTFFHYFPTKLDVLRALFDVGAEDATEWFHSRNPGEDPRSVLLAHARHAADEAADERTVGFVVAMSGVMSRPEVAELLAADQQIARDGLTPWVERARELRQIRTDWSVSDTVSWLLLIEDAFIGALATTPGFNAAEQTPALLDVVARMLNPA